MSETYEDINTEQSNGTEWDQLGQVEFNDGSAPEQYTEEELAEIRRIEERRAECQKWLQEKEAEFKKCEANGESGYDQAEKYYLMESTRLLVESYDDSIAKIKNHESAEVSAPKKEDYIPEEARAILARIPDTGNFRVLKEHVENAYYSINVQFQRAMEKYGTIQGRREKYLEQAGMVSNDEENTFWMMKRHELSIDHDYNVRQAKSFLKTAESFAGKTREPDDLSYALYMDDERWDLRYYH